MTVKNNDYEKVLEIKLQKEPDFIYYLDKKCNIYKMKLPNNGEKRKDEIHGPFLVMETSVNSKEPNYIYFLDQDGDISRIDMLRYEKNKKKGKS